MHSAFDKRICIQMTDIILGMYLYRFPMMMFILPEDLFTGVPRDPARHGEEQSGSGEEEADTGPRTDRSAGGDILFYFENHVCCRLLLLFS